MRRKLEDLYRSSPVFRRLYRWLRGNPTVERKLQEVDGRVLDVGVGAHPIRADVIIDRYTGDTGHRTGEVFDAKPFVKGDIEHLPFETDAFGYVHARQVVEHAADADAAIAELERVGEHGYIESPAPLLERYCGGMCVSGHHRWVLHESDDGVEPVPAADAEYQKYGPLPERLYSVLPVRVPLLLLNRYVRFLHTTHHW
jgi:hypothetical protein